MKDTLVEYHDDRSIKKIEINHDIPYTNFKKWCYRMQYFTKREVKGTLTTKEVSKIVMYILAKYNRA